MPGYQHQPPDRQLAAARDVYAKAKIQASRIIAQAEQDARNIIQTARMEAERVAGAIREKARADGIALADMRVEARAQEIAKAKVDALQARRSDYGRTRRGKDRGTEN